MINKYNYKKETWIDLHNATSEEIGQIMDEYAVHPFIGRELILTTPKPRIEFFENYIYCILHFPAFKHTHSKNKSNQEIDFVLGKDILITARYDTVDSLDKFAKDLEVKEVTDKPSDLNGHSIFIYMIKELYKGIFDELLYIEDTIDQITERIFEGKEREMVISISEITKVLLEFKKTTDLHREVLESLAINSKEIFGKQFTKDMELVYMEYTKIHGTILSDLEMLGQLRDTNNSLLTTKQNEIMKQLTIMGFIILPLTIIAGVFGMTFPDLPLSKNPNGFWIVLGTMITSALVAVAYAKNKKWM
ncbi:MAG: CorA family divalent cation transporter [Candidatus Paceibacterota bacterium]